jgi:hypothetical protein
MMSRSVHFGLGLNSLVKFRPFQYSVIAQRLNCYGHIERAGVSPWPPLLMVLNRPLRELVPGMT